MRKVAAVSSLFLMVVLTLALSTSALAQDKKIAHRIAKQQARIDEGMRKGWLTHEEAKIVQANLDHIRSVYERALAQGTLRPERGRIMGLLKENGWMVGKVKKTPVRRLN
ncbi:MAG TPA: hypothetical protein VEF34_01345 [Syntrophobacteraceae bacterium]|nr:hypothetical protein [Syntrophobacteraceae bacterium]